jgi:hypothetical protein
VLFRSCSIVNVPRVKNNGTMDKHNFTQLLAYIEAVLVRPQLLFPARVRHSPQSKGADITAKILDKAYNKVECRVDISRTASNPCEVSDMSARIRMH